MQIGVGVPSVIPGTTGRQVLQWAAEAERLGFSTLGVIDRLVYANTEPLTTLAGVAAVTNRIGLMTSVLLAPLRGNAALLAKEAASVNHLSAGRLTLGMAVGGYRDDYEASGLPFAGRGRVFDEMLPTLRRVWDGEPQAGSGVIGPPGGLPRSQVMFGGGSDRAAPRIARWGGGWLSGARGVEVVRAGAETVREAWRAHGRRGEPALIAQPYFALGREARSLAHAFLTDHYAIEGEQAAVDIAGRALTDRSAVAEAVDAYREAGCTELLLFPCSADPDQLEMLAAAL